MAIELGIHLSIAFSSDLILKKIRSLMLFSLSHKSFVQLPLLSFTENGASLRNWSYRRWSNSHLKFNTILCLWNLLSSDSGMKNPEQHQHVDTWEFQKLDETRLKSFFNTRKKCSHPMGVKTIIKKNWILCSLCREQSLSKHF